MKISGIASAGMIIMLTVSVSGYAFTFGLAGNESGDDGERAVSRSKFMPFGNSPRVSVEINIETLKPEKRWGGSLKEFSPKDPVLSYPVDSIRNGYPSSASADSSLSLS